MKKNLLIVLTASPLLHLAAKFLQQFQAIGSTNLTNTLVER